jgi:ligand-binding SRPBCC domain-containing protein
MSIVELTFCSEVAAPQDRVWHWITSIEGISQELAPLARMTVPRGIENLSQLNLEPGKPLFRSWVLLLGFLPIDRSDLTLVSLEPGEGFLERSPMLSMKTWQHERRLQSKDDGTLLTDRLTFEPRTATSLVRWFVRKLFEHRHAVLRRHFVAR